MPAKRKPKKRAPTGTVDRRRPHAPLDPLKDEALTNFFRFADPTLLEAALLGKGFDSKFHKLHVLMHDPKHAGTSLMRLSRELGISLVELVDTYSDAAKAMANLRAMEKLPDIVHENAIDALPTMDVCPMCNGEKRVSDPNDITTAGTPRRKRCPKCLGKGEIRKPGNTDAKKLAYEHTGLIQKGGGVHLNQQLNIGAAPSLADSIATVGRVIDGTIEEEPPDEAA